MNSADELRQALWIAYAAGARELLRCLQEADMRVMYNDEDVTEFLVEEAALQFTEVIDFK